MTLQAVSDAEREKAIVETYELTEECLQTNYYGAKRTTESLLPLLQLSDSPRIVNVSSSMAKLEVCKYLLHHANKFLRSLFKPH